MLILYPSPIDALRAQVTTHARRALVAFQKGDVVWMKEEEAQAAFFEAQADRLQQSLNA